MNMADEQKKPTMPDVDLSALDDVTEQIDITQEIEEAAESAVIDAAIEAVRQVVPCNLRLARFVHSSDASGQ